MTAERAARLTAERAARLTALGLVWNLVGIEFGRQDLVMHKLLRSEASISR
jgi:hypothetical protein